MKRLDIKIIIMEFETYLNERGMWQDFKEFIEAKGYSIEEFGMED